MVLLLYLFFLFFFFLALQRFSSADVIYHAQEKFLKGESEKVKKESFKKAWNFNTRKSFKKTQKSSKQSFLPVERRYGLEDFANMWTVQYSELDLLGLAMQETIVVPVEVLVMIKSIYIHAHVIAYFLLLSFRYLHACTPSCGHCRWMILLQKNGSLITAGAMDDIIHLLST